MENLENMKKVISGWKAESENFELLGLLADLEQKIDRMTTLQDSDNFPEYVVFSY